MTTAPIVQPATAPVPPEDRGRLVISATVIARIAQAAAAEDADVVTDRGGGRRGNRRPAVTVRATARLHGQLARIRLAVVIRYPKPIGEVVERVRGRVTDRVAELADITVTGCDVDVTSLPTPYLDRRVR